MWSCQQDRIVIWSWQQTATMLMQANANGTFCAYRKLYYLPFLVYFYFVRSEKKRTMWNHVNYHFN